MSEVHQAPRRGKVTAPPPDAPPDVWLRALRDDIEDLYAAAEDATRPPGQRDLGRRLAREHIREAARALRDLLASPPPPFSALSPPNEKPRRRKARP
jgi:hypothetical protein